MLHKDIVDLIHSFLFAIRVHEVHDELFARYKLAKQAAYIELLVYYDLERPAPSLDIIKEEANAMVEENDVLVESFCCLHWWYWYKRLPEIEADWCAKYVL